MCTISPDGVLERIEAAARPKEMACALGGYLAMRLSRAGELHPVDHAAQALAAAHAEAPPSRLITQIGLTGDDCFGPDPRDTEYMEPGVSHKRTAAVSVSY